jgi:hypothetical protein
MNVIPLGLVLWVNRYSTEQNHICLDDINTNMEAKDLFANSLAYRLYNY